VRPTQSLVKLERVGGLVELRSRQTCGRWDSDAPSVGCRGRAPGRPPKGRPPRLVERELCLGSPHLADMQVLLVGLVMVCGLWAGGKS